MYYTKFSNVSLFLYRKNCEKKNVLNTADVATYRTKLQSNISISQLLSGVGELLYRTGLKYINGGYGVSHRVEIHYNYKVRSQASK